ncbi:ATP-binding protein [Bacillus velezensis]|uniref:ATP-binding protein n=1 Tax=Bacillus velezensis TaxID=492670 RepID=UPI0006989031|nr:ATP-binding protein [Bacillus velezensis]
MNSSELIIQALSKMIKRKVEENAYGLIVIGIPELPIERLLLSFEDPENTFVSLIGSKEDQSELQNWAENNGWDIVRLGFNTTHAVDIRNDSPSGAIKIAFVWEEEERLGSLAERGYQYIGPTEIIEEICKMGADNAENIPQKNLWNALGSYKVSAYITLEGITKYYLKLYNNNEKQSAISFLEETNRPRKSLVYLNLLPDYELLSKNLIEKPKIISRLIQNANIVERIQRADEEDRQKALKTIRLNSEVEDEKNKLKKIYNAYLRLTRSDYSALSDMELKDAYYLLSGKKIPKIDNRNSPLGGDDVPSGEDAIPPGGEDYPPGGDDVLPGGDDVPPGGYTPGGEYPPGGSEPKRNKNSFENLSIAAIKLTSKGEDTALRKLVEEAKELLKEGKFEKKTIAIIHDRIEVEAIFNPDETAIVINQNFTHKGRMGGVVNAEDTELESVLDKFGRFVDKSEYIDDVSTRTLLEFMGRVKGLINGFQGEKLLTDYINMRSQLANYSDLLAVDPLACLISFPEVRNIALKYIDVYDQLLRHLDEHYEKLHRESPEGVEFIYKKVLALDTIKVLSNDEVSVLLTALNPLVLWKYVELAELVNAENQSLPIEDTELLSKEIKSLPEPLLAVYSPGNSENYEKLGFSARIGSLPLYRSISIEMSDLSQKSVGTAAVKLASLYPPVKENLRILLVDPISTNHTSLTIRELVNRYDFKKATLIVAKSGRQKTGSELPFDPVLKELVFENKVDIEVLRIRSTDQLQRYLERKPVHLMGISGEKTKNVNLIESEGTKLHPLSVPHKIHSDPLMGTISLKPRSVKSSEDGIKHPFSIYHKVVSEVTGNYHSEFSMQELRTSSLEEVNTLLPFSQFVITIGQVPEIMGETNIIRLTQNVEISGDTVYTYHKESILSRLSKQLKKFNYRPTSDGLMTLLKRLQAVGGEGIFSTITDKGKDGFSESGVKGFLGIAVALNWYVNQSLNERNTVISLDSYLARRWLHKRTDNKRSDFFGIRQLNDGSYSIDIIEVKSYEATNDNEVLDSHAAQQLKSVAQLIHNMVNRQGDLFTDRRRELLRLQIFREALQLSIQHEANWIKDLNAIIDGDKEVSINLYLLEVAFDQNITVTERTFTPERVEEESEVYQLPIKRIRLGESDIQKYLEDYVEKVNEPEEQFGEDSSSNESKANNTYDTNTEEKSESGSEKGNSDESNDENAKKTINLEDETQTKASSQNENQEMSAVSQGSENRPIINSEIKLLLGKQQGWDKEVFWDHRRNISKPLANHNIIITGDPGKGKTQTIKGLMHELRNNNIPLLAFDFKDDYIDSDFLENERMIKFDIMSEGLPFNPLVPSIDRVDKTFIAIQHIVQIEGILKRVYGLGPQQSTQLRNAIITAFNNKGINTNLPINIEEISQFPTFDDVREVLYEDERKHATLIGRLDLLFQIGIFPSDPSINFNELMEGSYTLRLSTLPDPDNEIKAAVAEMIILAVHNYLISREHPRRLTRAIVLDEAHRVSKSKALLGLMREGRAFGIGMLIATQFPTDIPQDIYGCTETKLFLGNDDYIHAETAAKKLEGGSSRNNVTALADQIRDMSIFKAVLRNSHYPNVFVDLVPYYKRI